MDDGERMSSDRFPIGSYVQLSASALKVCHESLRAPMVFRMCEVTDPRKAREGFLAMQMLTGNRAYQALLVKPDQIEPARPCYGCKHSLPMNDRETMRCLDKSVGSAGTCDCWEARSNVGLG